MSKCWKCTKEFYSEDLSRTLCDECLERIPKTTATTDFANLLHTEMYELKIADLETKLAESEKQNKRLYFEKEIAEKILRMSTDEQTREILALKQQLEEKDKENNTLTAKLEQANEIINNPDTLIFQQQELIDNLQSQIAEKDRQIEQLNKFDDINKYNIENKFRMPTFEEQVENGLNTVIQLYESKIVKAYKEPTLKLLFNKLKVKYGDLKFWQN